MKKSHKAQQLVARDANPKQMRLLETIESLMDDGQFESAEAALESFTRAHPSIIQGWALMENFASTTQDYHMAYRAGEMLLKLEPSDETNHYNAIVSSLYLTMPFTTLMRCENYLKRFPDGTYLKKVNEIYTTIKAECERHQQEDTMARGVTDIAALRLAEKGQVLVSSGNFAEGLKVVLEVIKRLPHAVPPLNNASLAHALQGNLDQAISYAEEALRREPTNFHARANMVQYLMRVDRRDEAEAILSTLRDENPENLDHWLKILEALAFVDDAAGVIATFKRAEDASKRQKIPVNAFAQHLAAVAYARSGNSREAQHLWKAAIKQRPSLSFIQENAFDHLLPVGEQNGAWYFGSHYWLTDSWIASVERILASRKGSDDAIKRELVKLLESNRFIGIALRQMLKAGDPHGREIALMVAEYVPIEGLREFAFGQQGADSMRLTAVRHLKKHGLVPPDQAIEIYIQGEKQAIHEVEYEIYTEGDIRTMPAKAQKHFEASFYALQDGQNQLGLDEVEAALRIAPDEATLLNHKSVALSRLHREREARELMEYNAKLHPDYLFARCAMANYASIARKFDEAEAWLEPLKDQRRFHISEFRAYMNSQAQYLSAKGDRKGAARVRALMRSFEAEVGE